MNRLGRAELQQALRTVSVKSHSDDEGTMSLLKTGHQKRTQAVRYSQAIGTVARAHKSSILATLAVEANSQFTLSPTRSADYARKLVQKQEGNVCKNAKKDCTASLSPKPKRTR